MKTLQNSIFLRIRNEGIDILSYIFGLPLYTYYAVRGMLPRKIRGDIIIAIIPGWLLVGAAFSPLLIYPPDTPVTDVRAIYVALIAVFIFVGALLHSKVQREL
jgi:hypothetical protein